MIILKLIYLSIILYTKKTKINQINHGFIDKKKPSKKLYNPDYVISEYLNMSKLV